MNEDHEIYVGEEPVEENDVVNNNGPMASANILELLDYDRELLEEAESTIEHDLDTEREGFKKVDRAVLREHVKNVVTDNKAATNNLVKACSILIGRKLGPKPSHKRIETKDPFWRRRINQSIKEIRRHICLRKEKK